MRRMTQSTLDREIRNRIDLFLNDLSAFVKASALEAVRSALGEDSAPARARSAARARTAAPQRRGRRAKRTSEEVAGTATQVLAFIRTNPGQRLEQIAAGMSVGTKELKLPVQKLLADKAVSTQGQRRGTKYFAGGAKATRGRRRARKA
jgi:hypothetical protein